jgi:hypothetical protein
MKTLSVKLDFCKKQIYLINAKNILVQRHFVGSKHQGTAKRVWKIWTVNSNYFKLRYKKNQFSVYSVLVHLRIMK